MARTSQLVADRRRKQRDRLTVAYEVRMQKLLSPQERQARIRSCFGDGRFSDEEAND